MLSRRGLRPSDPTFTSLWATTEVVAPELTPTDVLVLMEAWAELSRTRPDWFQLTCAPGSSLDALISRTFPAAVKRMGGEQLARMARLCDNVVRRGVEQHLWGVVAHVQPAMQRVFALVGAEVAWRAEEGAGAVHSATIAAVLVASKWLVPAAPTRDALGCCLLKVVGSLGALRLKRPGK